MVRIVRVGVLAALAVGLAGWGVTRYRFGTSDQAALVRVEGELRQQLAASADTFAVSTSIVSVRLRAIIAGSPPAKTTDSFTFVIPAPDGRPLVDAEVSAADLAAARARWLRNSWAALISVLGVTLVLCAAPIVERRRQVT